MEELLRYILENLVEDKSSINIEKREEEGDVVVFEVTVNPKDTGRIIGRNGRIAQAIRSIMHSASYKDKKKYILKIK